MHLLLAPPLHTGMSSNKICEAQRQAFIDCMFINDPCVNSGQASFAECFDEILEQKVPDRQFPTDCLRLYRDFLTCRRQMVITHILIFHSTFLFRLIWEQDSEDINNDYKRVQKINGFHSDSLFNKCSNSFCAHFSSHSGPNLTSNSASSVSTIIISLRSLAR